MKKKWGEFRFFIINEHFTMCASQKATFFAKQSG